MSPWNHHINHIYFYLSIVAEVFFDKDLWFVAFPETHSILLPACEIQLRRSRGWPSLLRPWIRAPCRMVMSWAKTKKVHAETSTGEVKWYVLHTSHEKKPKRLMQKPLLERSYVEICCRNHGKRYSELPKAITWFDGEVESCCCFSQPFGITSCNLVCIVWIFVRCESSGSQKACRCFQKADSCSKKPRARPKV